MSRGRIQHLLKPTKTWRTGYTDSIEFVTLNKKPKCFPKRTGLFVGKKFNKL